ncbi:MAG: Transposase, family [Pseudomonadota bacterium]
MDYRYGSHTVFKIEYHFVWVTKYRYPVLKGEVVGRTGKGISSSNMSIV